MAAAAATGVVTNVAVTAVDVPLVVTSQLVDAPQDAPAPLQPLKT